MAEYRLSRIGIVMLGAADIERSLTFYRDRLGMTVKNQSPGFVFLDGGGVTLSLSEALARACPNPPGASELVFQVDHVRQAYEALMAAGVEFRTAPRNVSGPFWAANFDDPDGHHLSVFGNE